MENLKKLLHFLAPFPAWVRALIAALVTAVVSICVLMTSSSCGITQSVVNNIESDGNVIEIGVTPSSTTTTTLTPDVDIQ